MQTSRWKWWAAGAAVVACAGAGAAWWWVQGRVPEASYRTGKIERGPLLATVSASGAVNPVTQVSVGTQVSGQVKELYVDFNTEVRAGQLIAQIDPETFEYRVRQAQADVDAAAAAVLTAQANGVAARAAVSRANVDLVEAQRDLERKRTLVEKQFIAQSEADRAQALANTSREVLKSAEAQLGVTEAQVKSAQANVAQRQAALAQARVDLARTRITSPVNGIVIKRAVEKGQTVAASLQAPELFVIAQNLQDMQVDASIDESDVGRVRTGQRATFTVDAFPGQNFEGEIRQVRKAAQTVANVVTYVAVVGFSNAGGRLLPGMTANVRVVTDTRESVLKVPNAALRVRIAGLEPAGAGAGAPARGASGAAPGQVQTSGWSLFSAAIAQPAGGGAGGGGMAALRERLVGELGLSAAQQEKLEAITADLRPRFMALRELPEEDRRAAREKLMGEMRSRIAAILDAGQKAKYAQMQQEAAGARAGGGGGAAGGGAGGMPGAAPQAAVPAERAQPAARAAASAPAQAAASAGLAAPSTGLAVPSAGAAAASSSAAAPTAPAAGASPGGAGPGGAGPGGAGPGSAGPGSAGPGSAGSAGSGNPLAEFRARLATELQLTPSQVEQVDAIYAGMRPRFMQLRDLPAEERPKARERLMGEIRARIGDILTPQQKPKYAALQAEAAGRTSTRGRIYLLGEDGKPRAVNVRLGITDGTMTELVLGPNHPDAALLKEGALVVTSVVQANAPASPARAAGPRMPF